jgi:hypothetical protein
MLEDILNNSTAMAEGCGCERLEVAWHEEHITFSLVWGCHAGLCSMCNHDYQRGPPPVLHTLNQLRRAPNLGS